MLSRKSIDILLLLDEVNELKEIANRLNLSERTIRYEIENLNYYLKKFGINEIQIVSKKVEKPEMLNYNSVLKYLNKDNYSYSKEERADYILANYLFNSVNMKQSSLEEELNVSATTIANDMNRVKDILSSNKLEFSSYSKDFEYIVGNEKNIRQFILNFLIDYMFIEKKFPGELKIKKVMENYFKDLELIKVRAFIKKIQEKLQKIISDEAYKILTLYLMIMIKRVKEKKVLKEINNPNFITSSDEFKIISVIVNQLENSFDVKLNNQEIMAFSEYVLGSHSYNFDYSYYENWIQLEILVNKLVIDINSKIDINILGDNILFEGLLNHLRPAIYRVKQGIKLENPIYEEVLENYPELFNMIRESMKNLEHYLEIEINEDEIAFVTIHFKEAIDRREEKTLKNIIIVCGFGYGSSKLLKENIKKYFDVNVVSTMPLHKFEEITDFNNIDLIISTVLIKEEKVSVVHVSPILTKEDIEKLESYGLDKERKLIYLEELLEIIKQHAEIKDEKALIESLTEKYKSKIAFNIENKKHNLEIILGEENIYTNLSFDSWESALYFGGEVLEEKKAVNSEYVESIINILKTHGSYMVINDHILLAHGRNEDNVFETSMLLMTLDNFIEFPSGKEIKMIILFSSKDNKEHLNALLKLTELLDEKNLYDEIIDLETRKEVYKKILELL
ncbi:MAG: transcription antiterminator [Sebaldella sp.]|nr:transcription antiterminator [Sebaldella sp.]